MEKYKFFELLSRLKHLPRKGWVLQGINEPETVASHMYRMALCIFMLPESYNSNKLVKMALVHDLAESIVGDITPHDGVTSEEKRKMEENAMHEIVGMLPEWSQIEVLTLWNEYENASTDDARVVKDLDKFDMILQGFEYEKKYKIDLSGFFQGIQVFNNKEITQWAKGVYEDREKYYKSLQEKN